MIAIYFNSNSGKHLTLEERRIIHKGIEAGADKAAIARTIFVSIRPAFRLNAPDISDASAGGTTVPSVQTMFHLNAQGETDLQELVTDVPNTFIAGLTSTGTTRNVQTLNIKKCS